MRNHIQQQLSHKGKIILNFIKENKLSKTKTAKEVSKEYHIPLSTVKFRIKELERQELVERKQNLLKLSDLSKVIL